MPAAGDLSVDAAGVAARMTFPDRRTIVTATTTAVRRTQAAIIPSPIVPSARRCRSAD
jgi:hypothetical protein